jgi:leucyl aminopeptidase
MPDAVKVGFVPFSSAPRGILVVFCDDTLKFGSATGKALGAAAGMVKRAAAANQFKGKSASTLDFLAPEGVKASRLIVVGTGKPPISGIATSSSWAAPRPASFVRATRP